MTIYTVIASTTHTAWIAKSFTCEQTANKFLHLCRSCANRASSVSKLLTYSPDPGLVKPHVLDNLHGDRIYYTMESNELVTDAFMELTLQPHKPRPFKEFI